MTLRFLGALIAAITGLAIPADAGVYWSSIAAGCMPGSNSIQSDSYTSEPDKVVVPSAGSVDPIVLICNVPFKDNAALPTILSMTYRDSTGTAGGAKVIAQLVRATRTTGARSVVVSVNSDSNITQTTNLLKSAAFAPALDFMTFYYYVRIVISRAMAAQDVESVGVALEAPPIASFSPALSYARVGSTTNAPTFPQPLTVTLSGPSTSDTTITIGSSNTGALTASDVTIPAGNTSGQILVTAVSQNTDVGVTATLAGQTVMAHVRVLGVTEAPSAVTLSPPSRTIAPGATTSFTASLDVPAQTDASVGLSVNPANAGTLPPSVTIMAGQIKATFNYTDASTGTSAEIDATFGSSSSPATVTVSSP
jgi:hypothetical protein